MGALRIDAENAMRAGSAERRFDRDGEKALKGEA
jgi:hypothetical protein